MLKWNYQCLKSILREMKKKDLEKENIKEADELENYIKDSFQEKEERNEE